MNILDFTETTAAECAKPPVLWSLKPDFTRAQFSSNERVHTESRCNHCGFRIAATDLESFDIEELEHASACGGSLTE